MRKFLVAFLAVAVSALVARATLAGDPPAKPVTVVKMLNDHCPVTGEEINPEVSHVWGGLEIRFCCEGCIPDFVKEPVKYMPTLLKDLVAQRDAALKKCADAEKAKAPVAPVAPTSAPKPSPTK